MRIHPKAIEVSKNVLQNLNGRSADGGISLPWLAAMVAAAGDGDHCEIGSLFGASAIAAALIKKELGHSGKVICIDPYTPRDTVDMGNIPEGLQEGTAEALMANAEAFEVELELVQKSSQPWPEELADAVFVSAFIDGNHLDDYPWKDFEELAKRTTGYIAFDNFEEAYPDVMDAALKAASGRDWKIYYKNHIFIALRRTLPSRGEGTPLHVL